MSSDGGFVIETSPAGLDLVVTGDWTADTERALARPGVVGLTLNYARGFRERDLEFLKSWPVRRLRLLARSIDDLTPIYRLSESLEELSVQSGSRTIIDLARLPWLTAVSAEWQQIEDSIEHALGLNDLFTASYSPRDLLPLQRNRALTRLRFKQHPRLETLDGVEALSALTEVGIFGATRLRAIDALADLGTSRALRDLRFDSCRGVSGLDAVQGLTTLTFLEVGDCGEITSLHPLAELGELEALYAFGTTRILDADLSPLMTLPALREVRMMSRREYRPTLDQISEHLGASR